MLRKLALLIGIALTGFPLSADPLEPLLTVAHDRNYALVERMIRNAPDRTAQRDMVWALAGSDPATVAFTKAWVEADKDNPVALSVRAWSLYWAGTMVRGNLYAGYTWPPLLDRSAEMNAEALALATRAVSLDPSYLPASDAMMLINASNGNREAALEELDRIMALDPNRHSLVLTASRATPSWGGSVRLMQALCDHYAPKVADVPDYTADICLAQAVLRGGGDGDTQLWAIEKAGEHADRPFLERELLELASDRRLPRAAVEDFSAHLKSVGRMSVHVILASRPGLLETDDVPDRPGFAAMLAENIAQASIVADRDPVYVGALGDLVDLYEIEADFQAAPVWLDPNLSDNDRAEVSAEVKKLLARQAVKLDPRARRLLELAPANVKAIEFAVAHILNPFPDPLDTDRWALSQLTNAAVYANHQPMRVGRIAVEAERRHAAVRAGIRSGDVLAHDQSVLDEVYLCPYVRAVRLVDELCPEDSRWRQDCVLEALQRWPSPSQLEGSLFTEITTRGACTAERTNPIESLFYDQVAVPPLP